MKKVFIGFALLVLFLSISGTASASLYYDFEGKGNWFNETDEASTWVFDLDKDHLLLGDINANDDIISATLTVGTTDDDLDLFKKEYATMNIDNVTVWNNKEIDPGLSSFDVLAQVIGDHYLEVTIKKLSGDFGVSFVSLKGRYTEAAPVPEPATLLLLGSGLLGMVRIGRKRLKRA